MKSATVWIVPSLATAILLLTSGCPASRPTGAATTTDAKQGGAQLSPVAAGAIRYDGFVIDSKRPVKTGDSIPVLAVSTASGGSMSVLSVEAAAAATEPGKAEPWFTAFPEAATTDDRAAAVEAWRIEKGVIPNPLSGTSSAGQISLEREPSAADKAFVCSFIQQQGETFAARVSERGGTSMYMMAVADGTNEVEFPRITSLKCSDGSVRTVLPALLRATADIRNDAGVLSISPQPAIANERPAMNRDLFPGAARSSLWRGRESITNAYLRFFSEGTVIAATVEGGRPSESWFNESYKVSGRFFTKGSSIRFSIGIWDYDGVIEGASLDLKERSPINKRPSQQRHYELCR